MTNIPLTSLQTGSGLQDLQRSYSFEQFAQQAMTINQNFTEIFNRYVNKLNEQKAAEAQNLLKGIPLYSKYLREITTTSLPADEQASLSLLLHMIHKITLQSRLVFMRISENEVTAMNSGEFSLNCQMLYPQRRIQACFNETFEKPMTPQIYYSLIINTMALSVAETASLKPAQTKLASPPSFGSVSYKTKLMSQIQTSSSQTVIHIEYTSFMAFLYSTQRELTELYLLSRTDPLLVDTLLHEYKDFVKTQSKRPNTASTKESCASTKTAPTGSFSSISHQERDELVRSLLEEEELAKSKKSAAALAKAAKTAKTLLPANNQSSSPNASSSSPKLVDSPSKKHPFVEKDLFQRPPTAAAKLRPDPSFKLVASPTKKAQKTPFQIMLAQKSAGLHIHSRCSRWYSIKKLTTIRLFEDKSAQNPMKYQTLNDDELYTQLLRHLIPPDLPELLQSTYFKENYTISTENSLYLLIEKVNHGQETIFNKTILSIGNNPHRNEIYHFFIHPDYELLQFKDLVPNFTHLSEEKETKEAQSLHLGDHSLEELHLETSPNPKLALKYRHPLNGDMLSLFLLPINFKKPATQHTA